MYCTVLRYYQPKFFNWNVFKQVYSNKKAKYFFITLFYIYQKYYLILFAKGSTHKNTDSLPECFLLLYAIKLSLFFAERKFNRFLFILVFHLSFFIYVLHICIISFGIPSKNGSRWDTLFYIMMTSVCISLLLKFKCSLECLAHNLYT